MSTFLSKMNTEIGKEMENTNTQNQVEQKYIADFMEQTDLLEKSVIIKITELKKSQLAIDKNNLRQEMETSMVLQSNIIEDIFNLKNTLEKMKVVRNGLVGILHHNVRFKNQFKLKTAKEIETYIAKEPSYNNINIRICHIQNFIEKSSEFCGMMKQKIGFIRDLTKQRTQEMFRETE